MLCGGGNDYRLPHMGKKRLRNQGKLPESVTCDQRALSKARSILAEDSLVQSVLNRNMENDDTSNLVNDIEALFERLGMDIIENEINPM